MGRIASTPWIDPVQRLYLDNLGSHVGEQPRGKRSGPRLGQDRRADVLKREVSAATSEDLRVVLSFERSGTVLRWRASGSS